MRTFTAFALACFTACSASLAAENVDCSASFGACQPSDPGVRAAEEYAARGYELLRVYSQNALFGYDLDVEVVRTPYGVRWLRLRDPYDIGEGVIVHLDNTAAESLIVRWRTFRAEMLRDDIASRKAEMIRNPPCPDGGVVQVDIASGSKASHVLMDTCLVPKSYDFAYRFAVQAFALTPLCKGISPTPSPLCLRLEGDKLAALEVGRLLEELRGAERPDWATTTIPKPDVIVTGQRVGGAEWLSHHPEVLRGHEILTVEGLNDIVRVNGRIWSFPSETVPNGTCSKTFCAASSVQIWRRGADGKYRLESWTIGAAAQTDVMF